MMNSSKKTFFRTISHESYITSLSSFFKMVYSWLEFHLKKIQKGAVSAKLCDDKLKLSQETLVILFRFRDSPYSSLAYFGLVYKRRLDTLLGRMPIVVARCHHVHLVRPDRRSQRQIVQVHVYRKIRIVRGGSQVVVIVRRWRGIGTHIGGCVWWQSGAVGGRGRRVRRGVVRGEVLAAVGAAGAAGAAGGAGRAARHRLRASQALRQPGMATHELAVLFPHLQERSKTHPTQRNHFNGAWKK